MPDLEDVIWKDDFPWSDPQVNPLRAGWYSLRDVLARAIVPALDQLIANNHGHPAELMEGPVGLLTSPRTRKWVDVMVRIRNGFAAHTRLQDISFTEFDSREEFDAECERLGQVRDEGLELFAKWYEHLWD